MLKRAPEHELPGRDGQCRFDRSRRRQHGGTRATSAAGSELRKQCIVAITYDTHAAALFQSCFIHFSPSLSHRYRSAVDGDQASQLLEFSTDTKEANELVIVTFAAMVIRLLAAFVVVIVVAVVACHVVFLHCCHAAVCRFFTPPIWENSCQHSAA